MSNSSLSGNGTGAYTGGIPLNVTLHAWPIPKLETNTKLLNETNPVIVKDVESAKNYTNSLHNLNATGYVAIDDDLTDTGFTDVQTFILAGIATVIPLLITVATILGIRFLWKKYRVRKEDGYEGVLQKDESSEPLGKLQSYSLPQELKTSESQFTVSAGEDVMSTPSPQIMTPKSNGSVITMTLKNNHLIVETEETVYTPAGLKIESKGTTTKFVTTTVPDFKVAVTPEKINYNNELAQNHSLVGSSSSENILSSTDHGALVHCPPEETEDELDKGSSNTGLSQSDLSVSSTESQNPSYRYGNQRGYDSGGYGYPEYTGYSTHAYKQSQQHQMGPTEHKIYVRNSSILEPENESLEQPIRNYLMSDVQAHERNLEADEKRYQEEQRILGNVNLPVLGSVIVPPKTNLYEYQPVATPISGISQIQMKKELPPSEIKEHLTNNETNEDFEENRS